MSNTRGKRTPRQKASGWKWAFYILLGLILALFGWLIWRLQPVDDHLGPAETINRVETEGELTFLLSTDKAQLNQLVNLYLEENLENYFEGYTLSIDENVELGGTIEVIGFSVNFTLQMQPLVMENGDLQLRAEGIQLGSFDLPLGLTLNILGQQLELPEWVRIDSEDEYILVALNEFELENGMHFAMDKINLEEDDIRVTIFLPQEAMR